MFNMVVFFFQVSLYSKKQKDYAVGELCYLLLYIISVRRCVIDLFIFISMCVYKLKGLSLIILWKDMSFNIFYVLW